MPERNIHITQNSPTDWYWEIIGADRSVVGRGLAATRADAEAQADDYMALLQKAQVTRPNAA